MPIPTITVQGKVITPDGAGAAGGSIEIVAVLPGAVNDDTVDHVLGKSFEVMIEDDGSVDFDIIPTDAIVTFSGAAEVYRFTYKIGNDTWTELIGPIVEAGPDPIDIGALARVTSVDVPSGGLVNVLPAAAEQYRGKFLTVLGSGIDPDRTWQCLKKAGTPTAYEWETVVTGRAF